MLDLRFKHLGRAPGAMMGLVFGVLVLIVITLGIRGVVAAHERSSSGMGAASTAAWVRMQGQVPSHVAVFAPTWLPANIAAVDPSYANEGGGRVWTYCVTYQENRLFNIGDKAAITFTEDYPSPQCPSPSCLRDGPRISQPLPAWVGRKLPHAQLFVGQHAPEIVLRCPVGTYVYSIDVHGESMGAVLHTVASLRRLQ